MATTKNITMKQFNGTDYDTLYPKTKVEQVENLTPSSIGAVSKTGDTMTGNLVVPNLEVAPDMSAGYIYGETNSLNIRGGNPNTGPMHYLGIKDSGVYVDNNLVCHEGNLLSMGIAKIATGSYVGTGTFGVNNPCSLTFPFSPKILIFFERHRLSYSSGPFDMLAPSLSTIGNYGVPRIWLANTNHQITYSLRVDYEDYGTYVQVTWGTTTQWYVVGQLSSNRTPTAYEQLNESGLTYDYCAIG